MIFKNLFKAAIIFNLALWIRPRAKGLVLLCITMVIAWTAHNEYLEYLRSPPELRADILLSYALKWALILTAALLFFVSYRKVSKVRVGQKSAEKLPKECLRDDGFDFLRDKKALQSRGDKLIEGAHVRD